MMNSSLIKTIIFSLGITFFISNDLAAQDDSYYHALGLRGGPMSGISYKRFVFPPAGVIEGILGFNFTNGRVTTLTGLYEHHFFLSYRMNFFAGAGVTIGGGNNTFVLAPEAIIGLEYNVETFPLNFSLDYKPTYRLFDNEFLFNEFALSIRYILN